MLRDRFTDDGSSVSTLAADLASSASADRIPGPPCSVKLVLGLLDDQDRDALQELLSNRGVPASTIASVLAKHGHRLGAPAIWRHRRGRNQGGCACHLDPL